MKYKILKKEHLNNFINLLSQRQKVFAPVKKGEKHFVFEEVTSAAPISIKYIPTILPPKKFFMPQNETLLEYNTHEGQNMEAVVEIQDIVLFGVHTCDIAGIQYLNLVFTDRPKDLNYLLRKNSITIIGLECNDYCDEYASCNLMENALPNGGYDLFFTDLGDYFIVHVNTLAGDNIIEITRLFEEASHAQLDELDKLRANKRKIFKNEIDADITDIPALFEKGQQSKVWEDNGNRCLACGNCTNTCPTCYCFDVIDELNLDLKSGKRYRAWDSCQSEPFAKVAGGESFRKSRTQRQKHRFNRKFKFSVDKYSRYSCTGCGRCSRACMAKINLKETLTALVKEHK
ncbi:MAG: 4Fe-4S dicluster domain-containing protein [Candidatus Margulisbacteria bacterium]|nr:4Fe-4S dicluster domain-containing protein [Candidatus Margulisiibacteriota bacterium]